MRNLSYVLLLVVLTSCSPLSLIPDSTPLPTQESASTPNLTPGYRPSDDIILTDTHEVVNKMEALCCEDGWWKHLSEAEYKSDEARKNGKDFDAGAFFLESLDTAGERFDANKYFTVLTHLATEDGYVLDYVYFAPGGADGAPYLYARPESEPPFAHYSAYQKTGAENYLSHVQVDGTAEGYYELVVLNIMGEQFYLSQHFLYDDWDVVSSREMVEAIIERLNEQYRPLSEEQVEAALQLDVTPKVIFDEDKVRVQVLVFTKWGGFYERVYRIDRKFPHQMIEDETQLIPYNCGVVF